MAWINKPKKQRDNIGNRKERQKVYQTALWKNMRKQQVMNNPLCAICEIEGKVTLAEDVHHWQTFVGKSEEEKNMLAFNPDNIVSLCKKHHSDVHNGVYRGCKSIEDVKQYWEAQQKKQK